MTAQEAFLFHHCCSSLVPTTLHIPKHLTHHPSLRQRALTHNAVVHIHTHTHNSITIRQTFTGLGNKAIFSSSGDLELHFLFPSHYQTSRKSVSSLEQQRVKAFRVFLYGYKWVVGVSVHLLLLRVKSTALGVIH